MGNTLAYYNMELIEAAESFIVQTTGRKNRDHIQNTVFLRNIRIGLTNSSGPYSLV